MLSAKQVADFFLSSTDEEVAITHLKLQKLLYYAQGYALALLGRPLFSESISNWDHGPVVDEAYHEFKCYGKSALPAVFADMNQYDEADLLVLEKVKKERAVYSAWKLREMTHNETPWLSTSRGQVMGHELLKSFFDKELATETTFNFDLERMKERVENQEFHTYPDNIETLDDFKKWLAHPEKWQ